MKIIVSLTNWLNGKTIAYLTAQDLYLSRYIYLYENRKRKRDYREYVERTTLDRINYYLDAEFPKNIKKELEMIAFDLLKHKFTHTFHLLVLLRSTVI